MGTSAEIVGASAPRPVLVFGSLPGSGRDLDLLVRDEDIASLRDALAGAGYRTHRDEWVRFSGGTADAVDLAPASGWRRPAQELERLLADARPIDELAQLVRPAPYHTLLILARLTGRGSLPEKRRRRVEAALAEDPGAWEQARAHAPAWGVVAELANLERGGSQPHVRLPRPRRPRVVALSGIDGSGKSSQAELLRDALERLGVDAAVERSPFGQNGWLDHPAVPVKKLLKRTRRARDGSNSRWRTGASGWTSCSSRAGRSWRRAGSARVGRRWTRSRRRSRSTPRSHAGRPPAGSSGSHFCGSTARAIAFELALESRPRTSTVGRSRRSCSGARASPVAPWCRRA